MRRARDIWSGVLATLGAPILLFSVAWLAVEDEGFGASLGTAIAGSMLIAGALGLQWRRSPPERHLWVPVLFALAAAWATHYFVVWYFTFE